MEALRQAVHYRSSKFERETDSCQDESQGPHKETVKEHALQGCTRTAPAHAYFQLSYVLCSNPLLTCHITLPTCQSMRHQTNITTHQYQTQN
jgi:hypothetical protein